MNKTLLIFGAGGLAREVLELAQIINSKEKKWDDFIFIDKIPSNKTINKVKVTTLEGILNQKNLEIEAIVAIGAPTIRKNIYRDLEKFRIKIATLIHPDIYIPESTKIGKGVVIQYGCFISCNVTIEDYVYLQPHCNIGHDDILKKGCMVSGFGNIAGKVRIGTFTFIGLSSAIKENVSIGNNVIVGMGAIVFKDIPNSVIVLGNPARVIANNEDGIVR